jgi:DNA-binding LytR/AlgR family response regulator
MQKDYQKIQCIVIDGDQSSLELMKVFINKIPFLDLSGTFLNPLNAINFINKNKVGLIFSDIEMSGINGIQLINSLKYKPLVILISANDKYAIDGYDVDALDYILKPVSFDRLLKAANKAYDLFITDKNRDFSSLPESQMNHQNSIYVKSDYRILKLDIDKILFIEGFNDYVKVHIQDSKPILTLLNMKILEEKLPINEFARVHRSYIVSLHKIDSIEKKRIKIGNYNIPISHSYSESFFNSIEKLNLCFY